MSPTRRARSPERDEPLPWKKLELRALADRLLAEDADAVEHCVRFFVLESRGLWHGRARALMARRLKHRALAGDQVDRVVDAVTRRLRAGQFSEQFRDQLRLALTLRREQVRDVARACLASDRPHVSRLARWILDQSGAGRS